MTGRVGKPTGLSQAEPSSAVSALTGFDPSREDVRLLADKLVEMLGTPNWRRFVLDKHTAAICAQALAEWGYLRGLCKAAFCEGGISHILGDKSPAAAWDEFERKCLPAIAMEAATVRTSKESSPL